VSEPSKTAVDEIIQLPPSEIRQMRQRALELTMVAMMRLKDGAVFTDVAEDFYQFLKKGE
jgi:hypothetical protein